MPSTVSAATVRRSPAALHYRSALCRRALRMHRAGPGKGCARPTSDRDGVGTAQQLARDARASYEAAVQEYQKIIAARPRMRHPP